MEQDGQEEGADRAQLAGVVIAGKYWLEQYIGSGSTGAVYRARHNVLEKPIALKVLDPELARSPEIVELFKREAKAASRLDHPNSVRILDFGADVSGLLYIAMEFVQGPDLLQVLDEQFPLSRERVVAIMSQLLGALAQAHELGVVHRDLKPENVLILNGTSDDGQPIDVVKVCDFGVAQLSPAMAPAQLVPREGPAHPTVIDANVLVGTPEYMSPEQARGESLDARSDVYAAGVVLFQLLTNRVPFTADDVSDVAMLQCYAPPPRPSSLLPVDASLEAICLKAMSKDPEARYQNAREMRAALKQAAAREHTDTLVRPTVSIGGIAPALRGGAMSVPPPASALDAPAVRVPASAPLGATQPDTMNPPPAAPARADVPMRRRGPILALATAGVIAPAMAAVMYLWPAGSVRDIARALSARDTTAPASDSAASRATAGVQPFDALALAAVQAPASTPAPVAPAPAAEQSVRAKESRRERDEARASGERRSRRAARAADAARGESTAADASLPAPAPAAAGDQTLSADMIASATTDHESDAEPSLATLADAALEAVPHGEPVALEEPAGPPPRTSAPEAEAVPPAPPANAKPAQTVPGPLRATARIKDVAVRGSLATSVVQRAINRIKPQLAACYARTAKAAGRHGYGALNVQVELDERGRARSSSASGGTLPGLDRCVMEAAGRLSARQAPDTGTVRATWQVAFEPP